MLEKSVLLDRRRQGDFYEELLKHFRDGNDSDQSQPDLQVDTLFRIFALMLETLTQRLNQAPDKNLLAFLNMVGISLLPPRSARVPLVFTLSAKSGPPVLVPTGTQVSATDLPDQEEQVFETETDLTVIGPQLVRAVSLDPLQDRWEDQSRICGPDFPAEEVTLFTGKELLPHRLFVGDNQLLGLTGAVATVKLVWQNRTLRSNPDINWYWLLETEDKLTYEKLVVSAKFSPEKQLEEIRFKVEEFPVCSLQGYDCDGKEQCWKKRWIVAALSRTEAEFELKTVELCTSDQGQGVRPDRAFFNDQPLDISKDFLPFGERPKFNDTFYLASAVFARENTAFTICLEAKRLKDSTDTVTAKLKWEYWDGKEWRDLILKLKPQPPKGDVTFTSEVNVTFTSNVDVIFTSNSMQPIAVNGVTDYWIRVRLVAGDYGQEATYKPAKECGWEYQPATFNPPVIQSWLMNYQSAVDYRIPELVLAEDEFRWRDHTQTCRNGEAFQIHTKDQDESPQFYLAFDQGPRRLPVTLFFPITGMVTGFAMEAVWEYWNGSSWVGLPVDDGTRHLTQPGIVQFQAPEDLAPWPFFGIIDFWLRIRLKSALREGLPHVRKILLFPKNPPIRLPSQVG